MNKTLASSLALSALGALGVLGLAGCPDIKTDAPETVAGGFPQAAGPTVDFDPAAAIIPFPNNLVLDPTDGKVTLPRQCNEAPAQTFIRTQLLNTLDGFGSYESALQVTFSEAFDMASLDGHVLIYKVAKAGVSEDPTKAKPIPVSLFPGVALRYDANCANPKPVTALNIIAQGALDERSTYAVVLTKGIKTSKGVDFSPTFTWALIDQASQPVEFDAAGNVTANHTPLDPTDPMALAQLKGIAQLWAAHKGPLAFVAAAGHAYADNLVGWSFNTQSTDALDPTAVATDKRSASPASLIGNTPLANVQSIPTCGVANPTNCVERTIFQCETDEPNAQCFMEFILGQGNHARGVATCAQVGCAAVKDVLTAKLTSKSYQQATPNPLGAGAALVPGPWSDSARPMFVKNEVIDVLIFVPDIAAAPASGTVVFGHGIGSTKNTAAVIAPGLAQAGFSTIAIDFVAHDSRAVRVQNAASTGCADVGGRPPAPTSSPQCYALFLSADLAGTRDNIRQTVLDLEGLVAGLKGCGAANCGELRVDPAHISYMGISLGGIVGSTLVANDPSVKSAALNVPGVGLVDILENTASLTIRCSLVDALIGLGVIPGTPFNPGNSGMGIPPSGTCLTDAWKAEPGYQQFAVIGRWALDPADGANFTSKLATKKIIIQEVVNDQVVPNVATDREGALVGLVPMTADPLTTATPPFPPSAAVTTAPTANKWVRYPTLPAAGAFPGNSFHHASLLAPADATAAGLLGTIRVQTDAITFLGLNH